MEKPIFSSFVLTTVTCGWCDKELGVCPDFKTEEKLSASYPICCMACFKED